MRIGPHLDDTLARTPEYFALLTAAFHAAEHEIIVLTTGADRSVARADLRRVGVDIDQLITSVEQSDWSRANERKARFANWQA